MKSFVAALSLMVAVVVGMYSLPLLGCLLAVVGVYAGMYKVLPVLEG